jgi:lipoyl synthase
MLEEEKKEATESPEYLRMSLAAAMTLGLKPGLFYRNAKLGCINLLLTYANGCAARCAYCGLSHKRPGEYALKSFIRVTWPTYPLAEIVARIADRRNRVKRVCISMITNGRAVEDTRTVCAKLRGSFDIPVSVLVAPTLIRREDLIDFKHAGADRIGVAIDLATPALFDSYRGRSAGGPHRWERYWACLGDAVAIFGKRRAGPHFMVGMGETEKEMAEAIQRSRDLGGFTHLFSFFPEESSAMASHPQPPMDKYRRVQLARYLIDRDLSAAGRFRFDTDGKIIDFGLPHERIERIIDSGEPFRTSGCEGYDGEVACNRPFANSRPGPDLRNYPFPPNENDILRIRRQMGIGGGKPLDDEEEFI